MQGCKDAEDAKVTQKAQKRNLETFLRPLRNLCAFCVRLSGFRARHFSVSTSPLTNHFCISTTTKAGGSMARMAVAMTTFHSF